MNLEKQRSQNLTRMSLSLVALAVGFNAYAYFFLAQIDREPFYMTSLVFFAMAAYCYRK
jgi:hypothetical protein